MTMDAEHERWWKKFMEADPEEDMKRWAELGAKQIAETFPADEFADWDKPKAIKPQE